MYGLPTAQNERRRVKTSMTTLYSLNPNKKMEGDLIFDFKVIRDNKTIAIQREFDAQISLVWTARTTSELLDQWRGPKPWRAEPKEMEFREGGHWHYAMVRPEAEKHWSKAEYIKIADEKSFTTK